MKKAVLIVALALSCACHPDEAAKKETADGTRQCQCWAATKSGNRCKRRARPNERYCKQHSADASPPKPVARCRSMTEEGKQCAEKPADGRSYCKKHLEKENGKTVAP